MATVSIVPHGDEYIVRTFWDKGYVTLGRIIYDPFNGNGPQPWAVCTRDKTPISRHAYMRDARASAKDWFGNPERQRAIAVGAPVMSTTTPPDHLTLDAVVTSDDYRQDRNADRRDYYAECAQEEGTWWWEMSLPRDASEGLIHDRYRTLLRSRTNPDDIDRLHHAYNAALTERNHQPDDEDERLALVDHLESLATDLAGISIGIYLKQDPELTRAEIDTVIARTMLLRRGLLQARI